jgi:hypothetical protein
MIGDVRALTRRVLPPRPRLPDDRSASRVVDTIEHRPDGSIVEFENEYLFEARDGKTLMTMIKARPPERRASRRPPGPRGAGIARLEQSIEESCRLRRGDPSQDR